TDGGTLLQRVDYKYDVLGNRIQRAVTVGSTVTERFAYLGQDAWADLDGSNALTARRLFGDQIDQLLARIDNAGAVKHYLVDRLGSVRALTDGGGVLRDAIAYDGYGNKLTESDASYSDRYKFTGREFDSVTGLQYNRERWYRPDTGGWM